MSSSISTKALILAAGVGSRLRPITEHIPKCLVPVAGRPMLDWWIDLLALAGVTEAVINTHSLPEQVRRHIDQVNRGGVIRLMESHEPALLGSAGTIAANASLADGADEVLIIYADNLSDVDLGSMLKFHRSHDDPFTMLLFRAANPSACGIAEMDDRGRIVSFIEKPAAPKNNLANAGIYTLDAAAYREIAAMKAFDIGFDVLPKFVGRMRGWVWDGYHLDVGTHEAYERAKRDAPNLLKNRKTYTSGRRPAVFLDRDGTLIEDIPYLTEPAKVKLAPGAGDALRKLKDAGFALVVITNQSAVGRGMLTVEGLNEVHDEMKRQLHELGVQLDGIYWCPTVPQTSDRSTVEDFNRKPGPGMIWRAANELGLDLTRSWMIGDMTSDALAGKNAQCAGNILIRGPRLKDQAVEPGTKLVNDLPEAADLILGRMPKGKVAKTS